MSDNETSPIFPLIKEGAGWVGEIASIIGIPGVGLAAKLIEKAPFGSVEAWLRHRSRDNTISVPGPVGPVKTDGTNAETEIVIEAPPEDAPPPLIVLDLDELLEQYAAVQESEPFFAALNAAMQDAVSRLGNFLAQTSAFRGLHDRAAKGLWPAFALEWKIRRGLNDALSTAAAVSDVPALRTLLEAEFAAAMIDGIIENAADPEKPLALGKDVRLLAASKAYKWPKAEGFRPGYVIGIVRKTDAVAEFVGIAEPPIAPAEAAKIKAELTARLGRLSVIGRDELTSAWLRTCAASEVPSKLREKRGLAVNPLLSRMEYPLLHVADPALLEALRPDVEMVYGAYGGMMISSDHERYDKLDELSLAYAGNDPARFDASARDLGLNVRFLRDAPVRQAVERVIERLGRARDWL